MLKSMNCAMDCLRKELQMNKVYKRITALALALLLVIPLASVPSGAAYTPPTTTIRVGLNYGSSALDGANLQNVSGYGSGFEFGFFDDARNFVPIGVSTDEEAISMVIDKNVVYSAGNYYENIAGNTVVGCFHVNLGNFPDYYSAINTASAYPYGFVRYTGHGFTALAGSYTTREQASIAASSLGGTVDSGTSSTVAVVVTGTDRIIFEYSDPDRPLAVCPIQTGSQKAQTWFKGYRYYGAFCYSRIAGGDLTVVNYVDVEDYTKGVVPYEMNAAWPVEAQKAQAVCARTYAIANLNKHRAYGFDICNTTDCQVYHGTGSATALSDSAVDQTAGEYMIADGKLCTAYYMSCDGGSTEDSENVWSSAESYLRGKEDPYEADIAGTVSGYYWTKTFTGTELAAKVGASDRIVNVSLSLTDMGNVYSIRLTDASGRTYTYTKDNARIKLGFRSLHYTLSDAAAGGDGSDIYVNSSADRLRTDLSDAYGIGSSGIGVLGGSTVYAISGAGSISEIEGGSAGNSVLSHSGDTFTFTGSGYGHNVGMSQWGAYSMAKYYGKSYIDILTFYYTGVQIV